MNSPIAAQPLLSRERFVDLTTPTYLYTGAHAPALRSSLDALAHTYRLKSDGPAGREAMLGAEVEARASVAALLGRPTEEVAFVGDASTAWSSIALGWDWKPGDNIVIHEYEHPAAYAAWLPLQQRGLEVRVVRREDDWSMPLASFEAQCDERTVALIVSHVGYVTGLRQDVAALARLADARGIPLLLDASHSFGVVPVDASACAIVVSASYKWTLGPYGVGIISWNRDRLPDFQPGVVGWRSTSAMFADDRFERLELEPDARRFQTGGAAFSEIAALGAAVRELSALDTAAIADHALTLSGLAAQAFVDRGLTVTTPLEESARAGNVSFLHPEGERFADELERRGVLLWGGDGRVRASFHVMNSLADVDALADAVDDVLRVLPLEGALR